MKKYLSIILCIALILTIATVPAFAAGTVTEAMVGSDFEDNSPGDAVFTENGGSLTYERVTGYDESDSTVAVINAPAGDSVAKPSIRISNFNYGQTSLEFDFMAKKPVYGDFLELEFQRPSATASMKLITADFDEENPTGGTLSFKNINGILLTEFNYDIDVWYHFEIRFENATSTDALTNRIYCFVKVNGTEILNKSTMKDSSNRPINFVCWNNGSFMIGAKLALNSSKGESIAYFDNFNVKKTYTRAEVVSAEVEDGSINITFDKNMDADSFENNVELYVGNENKSISFDSVLADNVYTITPSDTFKAGYNYTVALKNGIKCYENGNLKDSDSDESVLFSKTFSIPMNGVKLLSCEFSSDEATVTDGIDAVVKLENETLSPITVYGVLALYKHGALTSYDVKEITVEAEKTGNLAETVNFSTVGAGDGAAFYLLDENQMPLCDKIVVPGSILAMENTGAKTEEALNVVYNNNDGSVTVSGKAAAYDVVFITSVLTKDVTTENEGVMSFDGAKYKEALKVENKVSAIGQVMADEDGYFELCFKKDVEKFNTENYTVTAVTTSGGAEVQTASFDYTNPIQLEREMGKVNSETDPENIMDLIILNKDIFELEMTDYTDSAKEAVGTLLINEKPQSGYENPGALQVVLEKAIAVARVKDETTALDMVKKYFGENIFEGLSIAEEQYIASIVGGKEYTTFKAFEDAVRDAQIICEASFLETTGEARALIENSEKADIIKPFELDEITEKYNKIKEKKNVFSLMLDKDYKTIAEIKEAFENAVRSIYDKENSTTQRPSNSGGGGGGGGGSISTKDVENIKQTEETVQKVIFNDISGVAWAEESIIGLYSMGIIDGDGNGNFRPDDTIKREELIKILVNAFEIYDESASSNFDDVTKDHWSYKYISSAYKYGLVEGVGNNSFGSGTMMRRQDLMTLIYRLALKKGMISGENEKPYLYDDYYEISDYARKAVSYISNAGLNFNIKDNKFNPKNNVSRAEAAATVWGFLKKIKE